MCLWQCAIMVATVALGVIFVEGATTLPDVPSRDVLPPDPTDAFHLQGSQQQLGSLDLVDVKGQPFPRALRVGTRTGATAEWNVQVAADTTAPAETDDVLLARFWMRCTDSMTGEGATAFVFELDGGDYAKAVEVRLSAGREWAEYFVPFRVRQPFAAGAAHVCFRAGYDRQTIEIGGLRVVNYGSGVRLQDLPRTRLTYAGREPDAAWRRAARERIERLRKADLHVAVTDASGKAVRGATVEVALRRHAFGFGTAVDASLLLSDSPDATKYRQLVRTLFNRATFENEMKWPAVYDGVPPETDRALAWLRERGIEVRGHNLVWPSWRWMPRQLQAFKTDPAELRRRTVEHVTRTVSHFQGQLIQWDVVNEPYSEHDLLDLLGRDVMVDWFRLARRADPGAKLFVNDYGIFDGGHGLNEHQDHFYETIQFLLDRRAPIDGIGIQSHFAADLPSPDALLRTLDRFTRLGLPIELTEVSLSLEDRQLQADYLRDYMTAVFSHPNVNGVLLWGFWEKAHWRPDAALYDADWSIRPAGQVYVDLVRKTWTTREAATTDAAGRATVRGFCGSYDVVVTAPDGRKQKATAELGRPEAGVTVVLPTGADQ